MALPAPLPPPPDSDSSPLRILVAEDDAAVRIALTELVESQDDLVLAAAVADAWAAVEAAARYTPDVAILDVRMPGGGAWATREIARLSPRTQVLAFSGNSDAVTVGAMTEAGARGYVVKGSSLGAIVEEIRKVASTPD